MAITGSGYKNLSCGKKKKEPVLYLLTKMKERQNSGGDESIASRVPFRISCLD